MEKASSSKRPRYDAGFRNEALRLASESRSTLAAARTLNSNAKLPYQWQKATQQPLPTDPAEARAQELEILEKVIAGKRLERVISTIPTP